MRPEFLIVGAGLTGATIARRLYDAGRRVLVIDRRNHVGGNCHDEVHACGLRYGVYGPHYFRTSCERVCQFVNRFAKFRSWAARVKTLLPDGSLVIWPPSAETIRRLAGDSEVRGQRSEVRGQRSEVREQRSEVRPANFEEAALRLMPRIVYETLVRGYTAKQWGVSPRELSADLARRFDVREDGDDRLTPRARWQGIPKQGYTAMISRMLQDIEVRLGTNWSYARQEELAAEFKHVVFTGSIDAWFGYRLGKLRYRTQHRVVRESDHRLEAVQVNDPSLERARIRSIDWSYLPLQPAMKNGGTLITEETPAEASGPDEQEYPFPDEANRTLYGRYRELAEKEAGRVTFAGRLGLNRYLDMDAAIALALQTAETLLNPEP